MEPSGRSDQAAAFAWMAVAFGVGASFGFACWFLLTFGLLALGPLGMILAAFAVVWYMARLIPVLNVPPRLLRIALLGGIAVGSIGFWVLWPVVLGNNGLYD